MKKQDRLRALIGLICVVAIVVGVLVWPKPNEAKANTLYYVYVHNGAGGISGLTIQIFFSEGDVHRAGGPATEVGGGLYYRSWDNSPSSVDNWEVWADDEEIENGDWILGDPNENPVLGLSIPNTTLNWYWIPPV